TMKSYPRLSYTTNKSESTTKDRSEVYKTYLFEEKHQSNDNLKSSTNNLNFNDSSND
ncbi:18509_t:CDS:1, partial [Dentiscutata erythropus]